MNILSAGEFNKGVSDVQTERESIIIIAVSASEGNFTTLILWLGAQPER